MNGTQTPLTQNARAHRNLELVATVATAATAATALWPVAYSRCHPIKKVATTGNTHLRLNIKALSYCDFWLSPLPQKNVRQQNGNIGNGWSPRIPGLLPLLPLLPVFFEPQEHVYVSNPEKVAQ